MAEEREREIQEFEQALSEFVTHGDINELGAGPLIRALPRAVVRSVRSRAAFIRKRRRALPVRAEREGGIDRLSWEEVAQAPTARYESMGAAIDGRLYAFGGFTFPELVDGATHVFDPQTDSWDGGSPMPVPVTHAAIAVVGSVAWIIGGYVGNHPGVATSRVQRFETGTGSWQQGPPLPVPRGSLAGAAVGEHVHAFGGTKADRHTDAGDHFVLRSDADGWEEAAPLPLARNHLGGAELGGLVYAIGGQHGHDRGAQDVSLVHAYDPARDEWVRRADLPTRRNHCEAAVFAHGGHLYVAGGYDQWRDLAPHSGIVRYSPESDNWTRVGALPDTLIAPVVRPLGGVVVATSGTRSLGGQPTAQTWVARSPRQVLGPTEEPMAP